MTRVRPATLAFVVPAILVVAISALLTLRLQRRAQRPPDPRRFSGSSVVLRMPSLLPQARLPARPRVAIVRDAAAASYYDSPATLDSVVRAWRDALVAVGADARIVPSSRIRAERGARVLVVPSSPCLTLETREAIEAAAGSGQGLIVSGPTGTLDAGCRNSGYGLIVAMTGASRAVPVRDRRMVYVTIPGGGPLSAGVPPGARIDVSPAAQVALRAPRRDALYTDYTLGSFPVDSEPFLDVAVLRSTYRRARVVYLGFELRDAMPSPWNRSVLRLLVRNAVAWTGDVPLASVESWPSGRTSAMVVAQDVEDGFGNARHALDSLEDAGLASTYFVTSDLGMENRRLTRRMAGAGEIGTHSENHRLLGGEPYERQLQRLRRTQRDLTEMLGMPVRGLRPPEEQFDEATMAAWLAAGGTYLLGSNDARCAAPELLPIRGDTLLLVPRVFGDDFAAAGPGRRRAPSVVAALLRGEVAKARALGGLYVLSYHSQLLARPDYVPVLVSLAREAQRDSTVWLTTAGAVAEWWVGQAGLGARAVRHSPTQMDVVVSNPAHRVVENAVIRVALPRGARVLRADAARLPADEGVVRLLVPFIPGRSTYTIRLMLAP